MAAPTKAEWRRRAATGRAALEIDHGAHVAALAAFLGAMDPAPRWVLTYAPMPAEVDLSDLPARTAAWSAGRGAGRSERVEFAITRTPEEGIDLTVHPIGGPTERHRFGFEQPTADTPIVPDESLDVVLVPGVAFDRRGNRLGHGAGYYDRLLARLPPAAHRIGITAGYVVAELPADDHDIAMTHLCGPFGVEAVPLADPPG